MNPAQLALYLVTDAPARYRTDFFESVEAAVDGGVTLVQYRAEAGSKRQLYETAKTLAAILRPRRIPLMINDHLDLALALDGAGLHLGQEDLPAEIARRLLGPERLLGLSITAPAQLDDPALQEVDYLGVGPVFPTGSKANAAPALGLDGLRFIAEKTPLPIVAIGGIDAANVPAVRAAGADGIAVVSALSRSPAPAEAARRLLEAMR
jgi:thiamine-phosphate pyrophosphorylase